MIACPRLYVSSDLASGAQILPRPDQTAYLRRVMRLANNASVRLFNGRDGEWLARTGASWSTPLRVEDRLSPLVPTGGPELWFSPLRPARTAYLVEKATELGVGVLRPVRTARSRPGSLNMSRLQRICEEASEQTGRQDVPPVLEETSLDEALAIPGCLAFCDEERPGIGFSVAARRADAILIGPEGGFTDAERVRIRAREASIAVGLGPRVLRAETATACALTLWHGPGGG